MRIRFITAATLFATAPAFAGPECYRPPGSPSGTAEWSTSGKEVNVYLVTSEGNRYPCGPDVKQNDPPKEVGSKKYFKRICGPLTIVQEVSYRNCTFKERAGISSGYDASSRVLGALSKFICASSNNITSDTRYELRDKKGQTFQLGTQYAFNTGDSKITDSCTNSVKTQFHTQTWRVGSTSKQISLTRVTEYRAQSIKQPSL
jgi:hypothetical protein